MKKSDAMKLHDGDQVLADIGLDELVVCTVLNDVKVKGEIIVMDLLTVDNELIKDVSHHKVS